MQYRTPTERMNEHAPATRPLAAVGHGRARGLEAARVGSVPDEALELRGRRHFTRTVSPSRRGEESGNPGFSGFRR